MHCGPIFYQCIISTLQFPYAGSAGDSVSQLINLNPFILYISSRKNMLEYQHSHQIEGGETECTIYSFFLLKESAILLRMRFFKGCAPLVSSAAVIRIVTQRFLGEKRCVTNLITAAEETSAPLV